MSLIHFIPFFFESWPEPVEVSETSLKATAKCLREIEEMLRRDERNGAALRDVMFRKPQPAGEEG